MPAAERTGGCLCGAVRYRLSGPAATFGACHCGMCRRFSGGVFLAVETTPEEVTWERADGLRVHASSDWAERGFCATCGSSLFWRMRAGEAMALAAGSLDSLEGLAFASEIYVDHQPAAYAFAGERERMTEAEVVAAFGGGGQ